METIDIWQESFHNFEKLEGLRIPQPSEGNSVERHKGKFCMYS